jgi:GNAT superfamily N-acetyltransferase
VSRFTPATYEPGEREQLFALMRRVGRSHIDDAEFEWWFERNPCGRRVISVARDDGGLVGMAAMSFFRMLLDGEERIVGIPVHVATDPAHWRQGIFSALQLRNEAAAATEGAPITITFPNAASHPIFVHRLGWRDLPGRRLWVRPLRSSAIVRYLAGRPSSRGGLRPASDGARVHGPIRVEPLKALGPDADDLWRRAAPAYGNHVVRNATFLSWRYADSPRDYRRFGAFREGRLQGIVVVGHTVKHGVSAGFVADLITPADAHPERVALLRRCIGELAAGTDALVALPPRSAAQRLAFLRVGFVPTHRRIRFIAKVLADGARLNTDPRAWHFTLGDFDFF